MRVLSRYFFRSNFISGRGEISQNCKFAANGNAGDYILFDFGAVGLFFGSSFSTQKKIIGRLRFLLRKIKKAAKKAAFDVATAH
jgi:hypothetical protein